MWERGIICPECMHIFTFERAKTLEEFDPDEVCKAIELFELLGSLGMLGPGKNRVEFTEVGMIIERMGDIF
jgi:hypothetical protein